MDELFVKALRRFATCLLINNKLYGKLVSSLELPIIFDDNLKTISVLIFIADFSLLSGQFDSFTFKLLLSHLILDKLKLLYNACKILLHFLAKSRRQVLSLLQ